MTTPAGSIGIVGLGVMGGSLALAWKRAGGHVRAYTPDPAEGERARAAGAVDHLCATLPDSAIEVDWWILATPIGALREVWGAVDPGPVGRVMDLASLQSPALSAATTFSAAAKSVSAHPMVGSEGSGFQAADADLYSEAPIWLSATAAASGELRREAESFWRTLGARPAWIDATAHDERMVGASHLPQMAANALARTMAARGLTPGELGSGGRDMTRLAASSSTMWRDILRESAPLLADALEHLGTEIDELRRLLASGDLDRICERMDETRRWRSAS